jgi:SAM-dependent methyltransferase
MSNHSSAQDSWRDKSGHTWARLQARTDVQLEALGKLAIDALRPAPAERIMDVGCGTGQTTVELARQVEQTGKVVGVDISEPMVEAARRRVSQAELGNVEILLGDAAELEPGELFDAIYSRFGVMFFPDPVAAFTKLRGSLKPAGRLAFVCWQALEVNPWAKLALDAARSVAPNQPLPAYLEPGEPGPFFFSDTRFVQRVLNDAGFGSVQCTLHDSSSQVGGSQTLTQAVDYLLEIGPAARMFADADPALAPDFRRALTAALAPYAGERGVWMPARTIVVSASN